MSLKLRGDMPCFYEISWLKDLPAILLRIHQDFIEAQKPVDKAAAFDFFSEFKFSSLSVDFQNTFGFDNAFERIGKKGDFTEFLIKIPSVRKTLQETCAECRGTGNDKRFDRACSWCDGTGKKTVLDWRAADAASASLSLFSMMTCFCDITTSSAIPQLLTFQTVINKRSAGIHGIFSATLIEWLRKKSETDCEIPEVTSAMKKAFDRLKGLKDIHRFSFRMTLSENGWFTMYCPGDAAGIFSEDYFWGKTNKAAEFGCHNMDRSDQQLTVLAGLAALHDIVRKETSNQTS